MTRVGRLALRPDVPRADRRRRRPDVPRVDRRRRHLRARRGQQSADTHGVDEEAAKPEEAAVASHQEGARASAKERAPKSRNHCERHSRARRRRLDKKCQRIRLRYRRQRRRTQVFLKDTAAVRIGPAAPRPKESRAATTRRLTSGGTRRKIGEKRATLRQVGGGETPEKCTRCFETFAL